MTHGVTETRLRNDPRVRVTEIGSRDRGSYKGQT